MDREDWPLPKRTAQVATINNALTKTMREIGAVNMQTRLELIGDPPRASVYFELDGVSYHIEADGHVGLKKGAMGNLRAVQEYLTHTWNAAKEGVGGFDATFAGLEAPGSYEEAAQGVFGRLMEAHLAAPDELREILPALPDPNDPYRTLGLAASAGDDEVRSRYRALARTMHPDVAPGHEDEFVAVQRAYNEIIGGDAE